MAENCSLCHCAANLCSSHIIPEFLYASLYDEKHRFHVISTDPHRPDRMAQKGIYEKLLCNNCEQSLSKLELYTSKILSGKSPVLVSQESNILHVSNIDYKKLKLFQLSVIWRASVSVNNFFKHINLGKHEEVIRKLLLSGNPGFTWQYGCVMCALIANDKVISSLMIQPGCFKLHGHVAYRFVFGGFMWIYIISNHPPSSVIQSAFVCPQGTMPILMRSIESVKYIESFASELFHKGKL